MHVSFPLKSLYMCVKTALIPLKPLSTGWSNELEQRIVTLFLGTCVWKSSQVMLHCKKDMRHENKGNDDGTAKHNSNQSEGICLL